jgi:hypothetical protein
MTAAFTAAAAPAPPDAGPPDAGYAWQEANQRCLMAALREVRALLEGQAALRAGDDAAAAAAVERVDAAQADAAAVSRAIPAPQALDVLCATFGLSPFERYVLLLCAGVELDAAIGPLCAAAQGEPQRPFPTFGLALAMLAEAHWSALAPAGPLRHWQLIEVGSGAGLVTSALRIDERVLHYLTGLDYPDERLDGLVKPVSAAGGLAASHRALAERLAVHWTPPPTSGGRSWPLIQLCGDDRGGKRAIARAACDALGIRLYSLAAEVIPTVPAEQESLRRLWEREAALTGCALLVDAEGLDADASRQGAVTRFLEDLGGAAVATGREPLTGLERPTVRIDVDRLTAAEQRGLWRRLLGSRADDLNGHLDAVTAQFRLSTHGIRAAAAQVPPATSPAALDPEDVGAALWDACRTQARSRLDDLARRIQPAARWADLVLPDAQRQVLSDIVAHVRQRTTVYESWGFAARSDRGLGISALFAGPSGTGKTMAAEVLANELRLDLYHIDLSAVVSKYIGETEKNLRRVFDAAEEGGAILLFDEADALFGRRSEVKDSHDRFANIEVSYLLQRMEAYRGLAILTTNMKGALDPAFLRRLRFVVQFPFPDSAQRAEIWRRVFPAQTPTEGLDPSRLARLNVAGGNIRNVALHAAFLAAEAGEPVRMAHLLRAARAEYAKLEKAVTEAEVGGWV